MLLAIIKGQATLKMLVRPGELSSIKRRLVRHPMGFHQESSLSDALSQGQALRGQLTGCLQLRTDQIVSPQPIKHQEELIGVIDLFAKLPGPIVSLPQFRRPVTFKRSQGRKQSDL
jgi:hypothetical protein